MLEKCGRNGIERVNSFGEDLLLSFKSEGHGQRLQEIGSVGRIQIIMGFWTADWQYLLK